jgi:hypothetical protein
MSPAISGTNYVLPTIAVRSQAVAHDAFRKIVRMRADRRCKNQLEAAASQLLTMIIDESCNRSWRISSGAPHIYHDLDLDLENIIPLITQVNRLSTFGR